MPETGKPPARSPHPAFRRSARRRVAVIGPNDINRLFTLPPGVPADRVEALRQAFDATFNDPEYKADVAKARLVLRPISVEKIKEVASSWLDMRDSDKKELQQILKIK